MYGNERVIRINPIDITVGTDLRIEKFFHNCLRQERKSGNWRRKIKVMI